MSALDWTYLAPLLSLAAGGVLCLLFGAFAPKNRWSSGIALLTLATAFYFQSNVWQSGGGSGFQGTYEQQPFQILLGFLFLFLGVIAWGYTNTTLEGDADASEYYALILFAPIGMFLMAGAQNLLLLFVGIEILSIPLYLLCAFRRKRADSIEAGLKYFLLGAFAAAFFLFGASLFYATTGTLDISEIAQKAGSLAAADQRIFYAAFGLTLIGLLFKASLAPFHFWTPDVYDGAPTTVTALMAGGTKAAAFGAIANLMPFVRPQDKTWLAAIAVLTLLVGNFSALQQTSLKRMLAYSGIAHAGILFIGLLAWPLGLEAQQAVIFYLISYGLTATAAFGMIAYFESVEGQDMTGLESYRGFAQKRPVAALAFTCLMLSLGGIPPTSGFLAKYLVFASAIHAGMTGLAVVGILFSVVSLAFYLRVIVTMYMLPTQQPVTESKGMEFYSTVVTGIATLAVLLFGIQPAWLLSWLH